MLVKTYNNWFQSDQCNLRFGNLTLTNILSMIKRFSKQHLSFGTLRHNWAGRAAWPADRQPVCHSRNFPARFSKPWPSLLVQLCNFLRRVLAAAEEKFLEVSWRGASGKSWFDLTLSLSKCRRHNWFISLGLVNEYSNLRLQWHFFDDFKLLYHLN